ncbi:MAG: mechanosensitive ion channel family protein [Provencibacterium sp.]|nr:mechanosensitive ion channel family protein [Provencibacterium sp.]
MDTVFNFLEGFWGQHAEFFKSLLLAFGIFFAGLALRRPLLRLLFGLAKRVGSLKKSGLLSLFGQACEKPVRLLLLLLAGYCAVAALRFPTDAQQAFFSGLSVQVLRMGFIICICWALAAFISPEAVGQGLFGHSIEKLGQTFCLFCSRSLRLLVVAFGAVLLLHEMGFDPSGLLTGIGLGGLTLALAAQDWASNLFGGVVILLDRPFAVGDWIQVEDTMEGVVEDVSFRSTRIRTFDNAQVVTPNSLLVSKPIVNWSRMEKRKISFDIGLTYDSPPERLAVCVEQLRQALRTMPEICEEPQVAVFHEFAESSLQIRLHCFSRLTGFADYMRLKERLNFRVMETVSQLGLRFAFPTRTLYLEKEEDGPAEGQPDPKEEA